MNRKESHNDTEISLSINGGKSEYAGPKSPFRETYADFLKFVLVPHVYPQSGFGTC